MGRPLGQRSLGRLFMQASLGLETGGGTRVTK
jgi:hypothetical protein